MVNTRVLVWDKLALNQFKDIYDYLNTGHNLVYAKEFKDTILKKKRKRISLLEN